MAQLKGRALTSVFAIGFTLNLAAQNTSDLINDQVASHFNQVFSEDSSVYAPDKSTWVPGNDKDTQVLGSAWIVDTSMTHVFETGIDGQPGHDVAVDYAEFGLTALIPLKPRHKLGFAFNTTLYRVDESSADSTDILDLDEAERHDLGFMYRFALNPRWELLAGAAVCHTDSDNAKLGGKNTLLGYAGFAYSFNPSLTLAVASVISSREAKENGPFPLFVLDWRINDRSRLLMANVLKYEYALNKDWKDGLGLEVGGTSIALHTDDHTFAGSVLEVEDIGLSVTYSHTFQNGLIFTSKWGFAHYGNYSFWHDEVEVEKLQFDPSMGFSIGIQYRF